jgi:endonuclease YncB( thermonuclease family)
MNPHIQSALWFAAGLAAAAIVLSVARSNPETAVAPAAQRVAATGLRGAVGANVVRVIDGDTFEADAQIWLGQSVDVRVRITGMDAPELHARCADEAVKAEAARSYLAQRIANGTVWLSDVHYDKYGGRVRASVDDASGNVAADMIAKGLARPYHGERRRSWCV